MPFLIALLGAIAAAIFYVRRARNAADMATELLDVAADVRNAARRLGFRRRANIHPAETIEDPNIAIAGIASAFIALDDLPTREQRAALERQLQSTLSVPLDSAQELTILGQWMVDQCGGTLPAITRLSRKLNRLSGPEALTPLLTVVQGALGGGTQLNQRQQDALDDLRRAFRVK